MARYDTRATPSSGMHLAMPITLRVRKVSVPREAVRTELRDALDNERAVRRAVVTMWCVAAFVAAMLAVLSLR